MLGSLHIFGHQADLVAEFGLNMEQFEMVSYLGQMAFSRCELREVLVKLEQDGLVDLVKVSCLLMQRV